MNEKEKYLNFPIALMKGFLVNGCENKCLNSIVTYCLKTYMKKYSVSKKKAEDYFNITNSLSEGQLNGNYQEIIDKFSAKEQGVMVGLSCFTFFDYLNKPKSDFEKASLLAFLALKSILGNKAYCKVDNNFFFSRMAASPVSIDRESLPEKIKMYANEYQARKLKQELCLNWGLKTYSRYTRGFYISFNMTLEELILQAELKRKEVKVNQLKIQQQQAYQAAMAKLKGMPEFQFADASADATKPNGNHYATITQPLTQAI